MRIFITGGTGFIGKPLCRALAEHELLVLTRTPVAPHHVAGDPADSSAWMERLRTFRPEVCVHLAWSNLPDYSLPNNLANLHTGIQLFQNLLEMQCKRIVVAGTCAEYGDLTGCVREEQVPTRQSQFAAAKAALRLLGQSLFAQSSTTFVWTRPFYVYGPGQRSASLIPTTIECLRDGLPPKIQTPDTLQDFVYVDDVAHGLAKLATTDAPAGTYNLGFGRPVLVRDLVNLIARSMGRPEAYPATGQMGQGFWANMERMRTYTGWSPTTAMAQGVRHTIASNSESVLCAG